MFQTDEKIPGENRRFRRLVRDEVLISRSTLVAAHAPGAILDDEVNRLCNRVRAVAGENATLVIRLAVEAIKEAEDG